MPGQSNFRHFSQISEKPHVFVTPELTEMEDNKHWRELGTTVLSHYINKSIFISISTFKTFFKLTPRLVEIVWKKLISTYDDCEPKHLLWTFYYLKTKSSNDSEIAAVLSTNRETLVSKVEKTVNQLYTVLPPVCT